MQTSLKLMEYSGSFFGSTVRRIVSFDLGITNRVTFRCGCMVRFIVSDGFLCKVHKCKRHEGVILPPGVPCTMRLPL